MCEVNHAINPRQPHLFSLTIPVLFAAAVLPLSAQHDPAPEMPPAEYEALTGAGVAYEPPPVTRTPAELKMSSQLGALFNPDLLAPGRTVADVKQEMLRLGQIRQGVQGAASDLLHVYVRIVAGQTMDTARPVFFEPPDEEPDWNLMAGWVEETRLEEMALLPEVAFLLTVDPPRFRTGSVTSAGDALHNGPTARTAYGVDGGSARVGVISDGVSNASSAQATGDLPTPLDIVNGQSGSGDEGTAMLEIIHDLAPGAPLSFHAAGANVIAFKNAINAMVTMTNCKVICDDVGWYTEPFFEHSQIGNSIQTLQTSHDFVYISAAGNDAQRHHQQTFTDVLPGPPDGYHDPALYVQIPPGGVLDVFMQWDEPLLGTPSNDYDLYLFDTANMTTPIAQSVTRNSVGETIYYTNNTASTITAGVYVYQFSGPNTQTLEIFLEPQNGALQYTNGTSGVDAIFGHPGHPSVIAVASTDVTTPDQIEIDCSQGPFTILGVFPAPLKPDVAAADGVAITGAGSFSSPFWGTSAAAPHVAGACALAWDFSPTVTASSIRAALVPNGCIDLPAASPNGQDTVFGNGRPLADLWGSQLNRPPVVTAPPNLIECTQMREKPVAGVVVSDPDAGAAPIIVSFSANAGIIFIEDTIPGGIQPGQVSANGSPNAVVNAPLAAINTTLAAANGLRYMANSIAPGTMPPPQDTMSVHADDTGATGIGGPMTADMPVNFRIHEFAYNTWQYDNFTSAELADPSISGDQADPDHDFYANAWEHFMGSDPHTKDAPGQFTRSSMTPSEFIFRFRVAKDIDPASYTVNESGDLSSWTPVKSSWITTPYPQHPSVPDAWWMEVKVPNGNPKTDFLRVEYNPYQ